MHTWPHLIHPWEMRRSQSKLITLDLQSLHRAMGQKLMILLQKSIQVPQSALKIPVNLSLLFVCACTRAL